MEDLATYDKSLWEKIKDFIVDLIKKIKKAYGELSPNSQAAKVLKDTVDDMSEIQRLWAEGVREAGERTRMAGVETESRENHDIKMSIVDNVILDSGEHIDKAVLLDTDFFDGLNPRNWGKKLQTYVENRSKNDPFIMTILDENGDEQKLVFAKKSDKVSKSGKSPHPVLKELTSTSDNISKLAVVHIDEIVEVSEENNPYYTDNNEHGWLDENGWLHRNAYAINAVNGSVYNLTVDIAKARDGRTILYATRGKIRKVGQTKVDSIPKDGPRSHSDSGKSIAQPTKKVNRKFSVSEENSSDTAYLAAVESGDMETAQRMVDEAAKAAGDQRSRAVGRCLDGDGTIRKRIPHRQAIQGKGGGDR